MFDHKHVYVSLFKKQVYQSKTCKCLLFLQCIPNIGYDRVAWKQF